MEKLIQKMIEVYKYTRNWKSWHIHASSSENVMYVPKLKVILYIDKGSMISGGSCGISEKPELIAEGEKIVSECDNKAGIDTSDVPEIIITHVSVTQFSEETLIKLIEQIKQRNEINISIKSSFKQLEDTVPKIIDTVKLTYDVVYNCSCTSDDECYYRNKKLESQEYILPSNYDDTLLNLKFDYDIKTGSYCKKDSIAFRNGKSYRDHDHKKGFANLKAIKVEIVKNIPYTEYSSTNEIKDFDTFMQQCINTKVYFSKK
jgi:hypothetical protein